jgi:hypothetical protein
MARVNKVIRLIIVVVVDDDDDGVYDTMTMNIKIL